MSDLGAIFHVKKGGAQYDAHAYTTLDECPEPNLKLTYKGQQAYVKLEAKGSGDVPCYVKPKSEDKVYQVRKEAIPTGSVTWQGDFSFYTLVIPKMVKVIKVWSNIEPGSSGSYFVSGKDFGYVGVTPGKTYRFQLYRSRNHATGRYHQGLYCYNNSSSSPHLDWMWGTPLSGEPKCTISWSPEINKQKPVRTDYH